MPPPESADGVDYNHLSGIFMTPDTDTPKELANALYYIHEMATPEGMDELLNEAEINDNIQLDGDPDPTPADVAVQFWLQDKDILERKHAERRLDSPRSFEYFQTDVSTVPDFHLPGQQTLATFEKDMDDWFEKKKRGRGCKVFVYPKDDGIWFLVRHGEPYKREGSIENGQSESVFYRPEKYDVLVYNPLSGEIRMNARSKGEKELYRKKFGLHLFGNENFFPGTGKYTLEPLRKNRAASLICTDVNGIEWVKLKDIRFFWGGKEKEIEIRKADDVFLALEARGRNLPDKASIIQASFQIKFIDSKTPRTVTIKPSNVTKYQRDDDSTIVEDWLMKRGFIITNGQEDIDESEEYENTTETTTPSPMVGA